MAEIGLEKYKYLTYEEMGKKVAEEALDGYIYQGKTLREWVDVLAQTQWIPCSERLPDTLKEVIIAFANEPDEYDIAYLRTTSNKTYIANGSKKEWVSSMGETTYAEYEVDAWMPIIPYQSEIQTGAEGSEKND